MPYEHRLLENTLPLLLENGVSYRSLESVAPTIMPYSTVSLVYPKTIHGWTDRTGITTTDFSGPFTLSTLTPISTADAGTLVISADSLIGSMSIGIAIVFWDERNHPIGVTSLTMMTSGWAKNAAGYFVASNPGVSYAPGFLAVDVSYAAGYNVLVQSIIPDTTINLHWKLF